MKTHIQSWQTEIGGRKVHYFCGGQGEPLIVIHGGGNSARAWLKNIEALAKSYTVYVPDLPGFGYTEPIRGNYFVPDLVDFIDAFARSLGLGRFHLVGHSLGGAIALSYVLKFPFKVTKLVLVSSLSLGKEIALWVRLLSQPAVSRHIGRAVMFVLKMVKRLVDALLPSMGFMMPLSEASLYWGSCISTVKEQALNLAHRLSEVVVPTLVVWGGRDPILPVKHAYAAAELIPDCRLKVFKKSGHSVYRDELEEFSEEVRGFLG